MPRRLLALLTAACLLPAACNDNSEDGDGSDGSSSDDGGDSGAGDDGGSGDGTGDGDDGTGGDDGTSGDDGTGDGGGDEDGYAIVDTNQVLCYDDAGSTIACPDPGAAFAGQDAQYDGHQPAYQDNGDGTVTDLVTGLMWQQTPPADKMTLDDATSFAASLDLGGHDDWRVPTIKELYSLIDFSGSTGMSADSSVPYIDTDYFDFEYGDESAGERFIDAQYLSQTEYVSTTMNGDATVFGVNFADGRIKGYPRDPGVGPGMGGMFYIRMVRGNDSYGANDLVDNLDGTVSDQATGLMWMQVDSGDSGAGPNGDGGLDWQQALAFCEDLQSAGHDDWRLPNAKELQSIVDYTRSPDTTSSPAIDPVFETTSIVDGLGQTNYPFFWTGTTHVDGMPPGQYAVYVAFGEAQGYMEMPPSSGNYQLLDVHGAGAQRSDPKSGDPADYPYGHGPQGDVIAIYNHVRCVRGG